ncbi:MAG: DUF4249 family protein [Bacteroidota bacterium]|nr:DUF4249 family protein [Bacteroidota bacterium]
MKTLSSHIIPVTYLVLLVLLAGIIIGNIVLLQSCAPQTVTGVVLPHDEKLVIYASLVAGEPLQNVQVTRTLPPLDTFNVERSRIDNAEVSVSVDGQTYRLRLQTRVAPRTLADSLNFDLNNQPSLYEAPELIVQPAKTYTLRVVWNGKQASAITRIPATPELATQPPKVVWRAEPFRYVVNRPRTFPATGVVPSLLATVQIPLRARAGEAYRIETITAQDTISKRSTTSSISLNTNTLLMSSTSTLTLSANVRHFLQGDSIFRPPIFTLSTASTISIVRVVAHDAALRDFISTQARNTPNTNPFGNSGQNPSWNIQGDGIGLFIGQSRPLQVVLYP